MLDTLRQVQTPEGLALNLRCAGPVPRAIAWSIDLGIRLAVASLASVPLALLGASGQGLWLLVGFLLLWGYPIAFELFSRGQTPGKRAMGLRVLNDNGTPVSWLPSIVRNLMRTVDMFPVLYGFGLASCLVDGRGRRLGDIAAGTVVVYVERTPAPHAAPAAEPRAPAAPLTLAEQRSVLAFAERAAQMTPERQRELAALLAPATHAAGEDALPAAFGLANHLLGRR